MPRTIEDQHTLVGHPAETRYRGIPHHQLVQDYRLPCLSRALDAQQISLQKQSRLFFHISGAGHEALLLGLARHLRRGCDWFFP